MSRSNTCKCPICGFLIETESHNEPDDIITCFNCEAELKIVSVKPLKLKVHRRHQSEEEERLKEVDDFYKTDDWSEGYDY
ncbi:MAG: hypothetical protein PVH45_04525 [Candidatus Omnitrophota bacterium]|jgi:lysine biosynthesis protein LysW